jgi:hypothetical protein
MASPAGYSSSRPQSLLRLPSTVGERGASSAPARAVQPGARSAMRSRSAWSPMADARLRVRGDIGARECVQAGNLEGDIPERARSGLPKTYPGVWPLLHPGRDDEGLTAQSPSRPSCAASEKIIGETIATPIVRATDVFNIIPPPAQSSMLELRHSVIGTVFVS